MSKAKNWCFTLNNPEYGLVEFRARCKEISGFRYGVAGEETGEKGTPHLQCYVSFGSRVSLRTLKGHFGDRLHGEIARGNPKQASEYCKKDGKFEEVGDLPGGRGHRSDLVSAVKLVREGTTKLELIEENPVLLARYPRFFADLFLLFGHSRSWKTEVYVYYGETGIGKTRKAFEESKEPYVHCGGPWFDGYGGDADVIFDDFGGSEFKLTYLLKLLDRYPMKVPVKGSFVNWLPRRIWITSNYSPKEWYPNAKDEHVRALLRRLEKVVRFRRLASVLNPVADYEEEVLIE